MRHESQRLRPSRIVVQCVSVKYVCPYVKFMCLSFLARLPEGTIQGYPAGILPCIQNFKKWEVSVARENEFSKQVACSVVLFWLRWMASCFWTRSCTIEGNEVAAAKLHEFTIDVPNEKTLQKRERTFLNSKPKRDVCKILKTKRALMRYCTKFTKLSCCIKYCGIGEAFPLRVWQTSSIGTVGARTSRLFTSFVVFQPGTGFAGWWLRRWMGADLTWPTEFFTGCSSGL